MAEAQASLTLRCRDGNIPPDRRADEPFTNDRRRTISAAFSLRDALSGPTTHALEAITCEAYLAHCR